MTVKELIAKLNRIEDKNALVFVGCQGYTNFNDPDDEYTVRIYTTNNKRDVLISDNAYYGDVWKH